MKNTKIEWCDHTVNFWWGCTQVSLGCASCFAKEIAQRFGPGPDRKPVKWGKGCPREERLERARDELLDLNASAKRRGIRERVFINSMSDWLDDEVPVEWLAATLHAVRLCDSLDVLLLTKRPENWRLRVQAAGTDAPPGLFGWLADWIAGTPPANVWVGTTVEDQPRADERREALRAIPARVHYVSHEPSLEIVDWTGWEFCDWFISGGESGPKARPSHPDAHRAVRDFCAKHRKAYLFKQWGEWLPDCQRPFTIAADAPITWGLVSTDGGLRVVHKGGKFGLDDPTWRTGESGTIKCGKKAAGRLLDGVEHNEFPEVLP